MNLQSIKRGQDYLDEQAEISQRQSGQWPEPQPFSARIDPQPYPVDSLPVTIREAVKEVAGFVKAPFPLVAATALSAVSLAVQAHVDVERSEKLSGPSGLFMLTIADSGERKTTCDSFFTAAIRDYESSQTEAMQPEVTRHKAEMSAWEAEREGLISKIRELSKGGKSTEGQRAELAELQSQMPEAPQVPRILLGDETPENLAWSLAKNWPASGILSSEAGSILGSHGMGRDSIMRNLGLLNTLWDGRDHTVGRRTSESFSTRGARLTVGLQIQETTLREFLNQSGALARGTGFLARFLVSWPESTQGTRKFVDSPKSWPLLANFNRRITEIISRPLVQDGAGVLMPDMLTFTAKAKQAWIEFHDAIEGELRSGGDLHDLRDVASKAADNVARLAALFHCFEKKPGGQIGIEHIEAAGRIVAWHLNESRRFFGELALPVELANAARLDQWVIEYCKREKTLFVNKRFAMQYGPLRKKEHLDNAISELVALDRLEVRKDGKRISLLVNPGILDVATATVATFATFEWNRSNCSKSSCSKPSDSENGGVL